MAQKQHRILPTKLQLDKAYEKLKPDESPYIKNLTSNINGNPEQGIGTNNPTGEGQNMLSLTPVRSNLKLPKSKVPAGKYNKCIGAYESVTTQEMYYVNYNSNGKYGIYVVNGNNVAVRKLELGEEVGQNVVVINGLMAGEKVVTNGQINLTESSKISIVNSKN